MEELLGMKSARYCARATAGLAITRRQRHSRLQISSPYQKSVTLNVSKHQTPTGSDCGKLRPPPRVQHSVCLRFQVLFHSPRIDPAAVRRRVCLEEQAAQA